MSPPIKVFIKHTPGYFVVMLDAQAKRAKRWQRRFPALLWELLPADEIADLLADAFFQEHEELAADALFRARFTVDLQLTLEPGPVDYLSRQP